MAFLNETGLAHLWTRITEKLGGKVNTSDVETIKTEIKSEILGAAPEELNTLEELAAALGQDENFSTTVLNEIGNKVDKVAGKGLSTEDFTTEEKEKLASLESNA